MPQTLMTEHSGPDLDPTGKSYSCLICRQRKVKCDRHNPCSNCVKAARQCSFLAPLRGKRKRTKPPKEGLHAKLRRYEELLKSYGANVEPSEYEYEDSDSASASASRPDVEGDEIQNKFDAMSFALEGTRPRLIDKEGSSRYVDRSIWSNLGREFPYPEEDGNSGPAVEPNVAGSDLFLGSPESYGQGPDNLPEAEVHPPYPVVLKLWNIYVDRVDPLMKILHLPTFWSSLTHALQHPQSISPSLEVLIFAFYLATIVSLDEDECQSLLGQKSIIFARYEVATRRALRNAGFLCTSSPRTLQAYAMFITAVKSNYPNDAIFVFSGVAIRLARKMGLHRDGLSLGLSPFESEMRRRLWWYIVITDFKISDLIGAKPSADLFDCDAKMPLNVADEDLGPDMVDLPGESNGITSVVICIIRYEFVQFLRKFSSPFSNDIHCELAPNPDVTLPKTDLMIQQIEDRMERKFLRYCDPSNTLHSFASIMVRSAICKIKLFAHNPRKFASRGVTVPQNERDIVFANATKLLEYANLVRGNQSLEKYMWQVGACFLSDSLLYVLIEIRHRKTGPEVNRVWQLIEVVLSKYPQMFEENPGAVYTALGKWTVEAWDDCTAATKVEGLPEPPTPGFIAAIRQRQALSSRDQLADLLPVTGPMVAGYGDVNVLREDGNPSSDPKASSFFDFSNLLSFEMDPIEWTQWENLVVGESFAPTEMM